VTFAPSPPAVAGVIWPQIRNVPSEGIQAGRHHENRYLHASKYGNAAMVAAEFSRQMAAKGVTVSVHHIGEASPKELSPAGLHLFSSPGRMVSRSAACAGS
jgi:sulfite reductase alpha subunit-like flavoprotein